MAVIRPVQLTKGTICVSRRQSDRGADGRARLRGDVPGALAGTYAVVTSNVVDSSAVESPPTQTSKVEASITQSRAAAFQ